jgi:hypothetical protein
MPPNFHTLYKPIATVKIYRVFNFIYIIIVIIEF